MTLEDLLSDIPVAELDKIDAEQRRILCAPFLHITRPDMKDHKEISETKAKPDSRKAKMDEARKLAAKLGIKLNL